MAKATVNEHTRRQAQALRELRERLGLTEMQVASRLWFKTSQAYQLYEQATSIIRLDQVPLWAAALGISEREFLEAVVLADQQPALRKRLEDRGLTEDEVRETESEVRHLERNADEDEEIADFAAEQSEAREQRRRRRTRA